MQPEQGIGEEVVIAIPAAFVVQGDQKHVVALERLEHLLAAGDALGLFRVISIDDGGAQGRAEPLQDAGVREEALHFFRLP